MSMRPNKQAAWVEAAMSGFSGYFADLEDPRAGNRQFRLGDLIVLMRRRACAEPRRRATSPGLQSTGRLYWTGSYPMSAHSTAGRFQGAAAAWSQGGQQCLCGFAEAFAKVLGNRNPGHGHAVVALDGKALRRIYEKGLSSVPPLIGLAFAAEAKLCLAA